MELHHPQRTVRRFGSRQANQSETHQVILWWPLSGRSFDELSSQGLKTLVNIAHSLAHHTVAIDRDLPMPGLLVLDGLSANAGYEGFDQARVNDAYRLLRSVANEYADRLQIVAVDNELPQAMFIELSTYAILSLTQDNRLIRTHGPDPKPNADPMGGQSPTGAT